MRTPPLSWWRLFSGRRRVRPRPRGAIVLDRLCAALGHEARRRLPARDRLLHHLASLPGADMRGARGRVGLTRISRDNRRPLATTSDARGCAAMRISSATGTTSVSVLRLRLRRTSECEATASRRVEGTPAVRRAAPSEPPPPDVRPDR